MTTTTTMAGPASCFRFYVLLLLFACLWTPAWTQTPSHSVSDFNNLPARLFFFDDTLAAVYHDAIEGNLYVSQDEGKSWKRAGDIPEGKVSMVLEHPFDTRFGFALTDGTTHYRTEDRGRSWRPFEVPNPPARVGRPLSFHSDPKKYGHILFQATKCEGKGWGSKCKDITYYTKEAFGDDPKELLADTMRCQFAHGSKDFKHDAPLDLIYCVAFDAESSTGPHHLASSRLFSSTDFFASKKIEDLGIGKEARGVVAFAIVSKYAVVALKDVALSDGQMHLYVSLDSKNWAKAHFPHASSALLRENAYTVVESSTHSLGVDVVLQDRSTIGTLFVSNSNGTYFVESLKDTNRNEMGFVDYERIYGVDGVGLANVVANAQDVESRRAAKQLKSMVTFDDGRLWSPLRAPAHESPCDVNDMDACSLHLHSVTNPHNFGRIFSSPAPGFVMGVGSVGKSLSTYDDGDTFLSTDAGISWRRVTKGAHKYEFGDQGSILIIVDDEQMTSSVRYSLDLGKTWETYDFGLTLRARALVTLPDSTSQKFLLLGQVPRDTKTHKPNKVVIVYLDFAPTRRRKCGEADFEKWYARPAGSRACLMGHKQWYKRRKIDADCYIGDKFHDPVGHEENCPCEKEDFECDYNFIRNGDTCEPAGPEPIPHGVCTDPSQKYMGSSGFRKIPGNTCVGGVELDKKVEKSCSNAKPQEGNIVTQRMGFGSPIVQHAYFKESTTILVRLADQTMWQSSSEGYVWKQIHPELRFLAFYHHKYSNERAFLITDTETVVYTTDTGRTWNKFKAPSPPNTFGGQALRFNPVDTDYILWVGNKGCTGNQQGCHAEAQLSRDNGRRWTFVEKYVRNCAFARDKDINTDPTEILCESYKTKKGNQRFFKADNPMELVVGSNYFSKKQKLFDQVVGFAKFSEFLVVAEMDAEKRALALQVSLDGTHFASGQFPPSMHPETHAYTVLESSTKALFLHMTMSEAPAPFWGNILKSNSNGTYFGLSIENVNRDDRGFVDFEKVIGLDGIALINVVANTEEAVISGSKKLQSRITHNDAGTWKPLTPPTTDSMGKKYECQGTKCALHIHGYTERRDPRATYSSPAIVGVLMAVGNVGESLLPYKDSDTFLSRDAGFTWEEVRKDAHLWEFGDSGSIIVMVNDEEPVDFLLFTTDEGKTWREYKFSDVKVRVVSIVNVPSDTSRRFLLLAQPAKGSGTVAFHVDFSALVTRQCTLDLQNPANDDFELWSPSEDRNEQCLFGRQTLYHRRLRDAQCFIGNLPKVDSKIEKHCPCTKVDFECEFNYVKDDKDECVLVEGTQPLPSEEDCKDGDEFWYERTAYRLIPYSSCEGGLRLDRGTAHRCPGFSGRGALFWLFVLLVPFAFTGVVGWYYYRRSGLAKGTIRLPGGDNRGPRVGADAGVLDTLASVPWFVVGIVGIAVEWVRERVDSSAWRARGGYRNVAVDEDAQILRFEDEE
ncbi:vacuolar protein sorting/targeting protein 10 [Ephemerocybe angulata]|uniref:Vacuolar protein sorting/targeting protein 10 n=1 Tax=Ephemerocybe angulata TaxID=980116 RepID=A0A8H6MCK4_9AGAR|nr:vacuolar protein sorting/targeting protein 10 [Tulosesus angulatus]